MNAGISKRVVGLAVLVVAVLAVLLFLPHSETAPAPGALPVAAVPLGTKGPLDSPAPAQAASETPAPDDTVDPDVPDPAAAATAVVAAPPAPSTVWKEPAPAQAAPNGPTIKPAAPAAPAAVTQHPAAPPARIVPAKPAPAPKAVQSSAAQGHFYIQVASFGDAGNAKAALKKLEGLGFHGTTGTAQVKGKTWTRVQIGPYANRASAQAAQTRLKAKGYSGGHVFEKR
ncbi:MAG: SPOR domain-containing protein [Nevskiaceae bacterium]|nr:MAG: SPOR domain-containing protein [Nevskiaceae bacterium]TBR73867.1 MAG: SPOR domain-containing protein [Nevskiaceae bacterium]